MIEPRSAADHFRLRSEILVGKRLWIYFPYLAGGGAERLYLGLSEYFFAAGLVLTIVVDTYQGELLDAVPSYITMRVLRARRLRHAIPRLVQIFRHDAPDIFLSGITPSSIGCIIAKLIAGGQSHVVVAQHNTLTQEATQGGIYSILPMAHRLLLGRADAVVAVSLGVAHDLSRRSRFPLTDIEVIPNGVITADFDKRATEPCSHPWLQGGVEAVIIGVGRLEAQKDFSILIRAFATLRQREPARLVILGEGPVREELTALASSLGVSESVDLPGYVANPLPYIQAADALVLSSRYEGFGLVLAEALACGTPVVSTNCPYGPADILADGRYGALVPVGDADAMAAAIADTLDHPPASELLRARGREYSVEKCAQRYLDLFERVLSRPQRGR